MLVKGAQTICCHNDPIYANIIQQCRHKLEQLERLRSENTPSPHDTPYDQFLSDDFPSK